MPHDLDRDYMNYCSTCIYGFKGHPQGHWPCITCAQNLIYINKNSKHLKNHYIQGKIIPIEKEIL